ncbi:MAG: ATP-binding protein [Cyanobacteria bacterium J06633_8]
MTNFNPKNHSKSNNEWAELALQKSANSSTQYHVILGLFGSAFLAGATSPLTGLIAGAYIIWSAWCKSGESARNKEHIITSRCVANTLEGDDFHFYREQFGDDAVAEQLQYAERLNLGLSNDALDFLEDYETTRALPPATESTLCADSPQSTESTPIARHHQSTKSIESSHQPDLMKLPLKQRGETIIQKLIESGFQVDECLAGQIIALCGTQRGGKGTLAGILSILSQAVEPGAKVHYFSAGTDIYPFKCEKLVCGLTYSNAENPDKKVATDLIKYLKELDKQPAYSANNRVIVLDELMTLTDLLSEEDKLWLVRFLMVRAAKKGATIILVLHASTISAWVGSKNTDGLSASFKNLTFVGCTSKNVNSGALKKVSIATGHYFKADPNSFGTPTENGDLGHIPEWLKQLKNPANGHPDPVRTLLQFFPELMGNIEEMSKVNNTFIALPDAPTVIQQPEVKQDETIDNTANKLDKLFNEGLDSNYKDVSEQALLVLDKLKEANRDAKGEPVKVKAVCDKVPLGKDNKSAKAIRYYLGELIIAKLAKKIGDEPSELYVAENIN